MAAAFPCPMRCWSFWTKAGRWPNPWTRSTSHSAHALGALSQRGVSTSGLLQRYGITPTTLSSVLADDVMSRRIDHDAIWSCQARGRRAEPGLPARDPAARPAQPAVAVRRTVTWCCWDPPASASARWFTAWPCLMAESKGPAGLGKVVQVGEAALLDDAAAAVQAGLRQADGGILFLPNIHRFFGGSRARRFFQGHPARPKGALERRWHEPGRSTRLDRRCDRRRNHRGRLQRADGWRSGRGRTCARRARARGGREGNRRDPGRA